MFIMSFTSAVSFCKCIGRRNGNQFKGRLYQKCWQFRYLVVTQLTRISLQIWSKWYFKNKSNVNKRPYDAIKVKNELLKLTTQNSSIGWRYLYLITITTISYPRLISRAPLRSSMIYSWRERPILRFGCCIQGIEIKQSDIYFSRKTGIFLINETRWTIWCFWIEIPINNTNKYGIIIMHDFRTLCRNVLARTERKQPYFYCRPWNKGEILFQLFRDPGFRATQAWCLVKS